MFTVYFQNGNISLIIYICTMSLYHFLTNTLIWISIFYLSVKGFTTHRQISFRKYLNVSCKLYPPRQTARIDYWHIWPIRLELVIILMFILSCKFYYLVVHMDTSRLYRARKMLKFVGLFLHFIFSLTFYSTWAIKYAARQLNIAINRVDDIFDSDATFSSKEV